MISTDVAVIGGGAAGLMAAITAARQGAKTAVIEHMDRVGKKILATGNGKCNYTNAKQGVSYYRGEDPAFVLPVFGQFGLAETLRFFEEIGVYPKCRNGYYYPASEQAASVLDVLRMEADASGVEIFTLQETKNIAQQKIGFCIETNRERFLARSLVLAPGLMASPKTGSDGSMMPYIEELGHSVIDIVPALVQLQGKQSFFKAIARIRAEIVVSLYVDGRLTATEQGELQLTDYGISGIPVFQVSRFATKALKRGQKVHALLHFLPQIGTAGEMEALLSQRFLDASAHGRAKDAEQAMVGLLPKKLIGVLLREADIVLHAAAGEVTKRQMHRLAKTICGLRVDVIGSKGFDAAQVCAGGVSTAEIDAVTLESKIVPGVYFAGEVVDIDGCCGGYNLQWAWSSGYVAGLHAAQSGKHGKRMRKGARMGQVHVPQNSQGVSPKSSRKRRTDDSD